MSLRICEPEPVVRWRWCRGVGAAAWLAVVVWGAGCGGGGGGDAGRLEAGTDGGSGGEGDAAPVRDGAMDATGPGAADAGADGGTARAVDAGPPYDRRVFRATHNSYSGGSRDSVLAQLGAGVRFIELDVHDNDYASVGDYRVGHDAPGDEVARGGDNPATDRLGEWLELIAGWSRDHPGHAPLTIALDLKDDLTDNPNAASGNLAAINQALRHAFGDRLLSPPEVGDGWPGTATMRGRVLAVLSGDPGTREMYVRDPGENPAVAINARGQVVEVHDSGRGTLWYWTGEHLPDGSIRWHRHGRYDTGQTPAVALDDDGWLVEVHQSESAATLWYHVGRLDEDFEIRWSESRQYDTGIRPTVRFVDAAGTRVREIHRSESEDQNWFWEGSLDTEAMAVDWGEHDRTSDALLDKQRASAAGAMVRVFTATDGDAPADTLQYETDRSAGRIRYRPLAFVEYQQGDAADLRRHFFAAPSGAHELAARWRREGGVVRLWGFARGDTDLSPPVQLPATDEPFAEWYDRYCDEVGALE